MPLVYEFYNKILSPKMKSKRGDDEANLMNRQYLAKVCFIFYWTYFQKEPSKRIFTLNFNQIFLIDKLVGYNSDDSRKTSILY
jgi:hypothetical protein